MVFLLAKFDFPSPGTAEYDFQVRRWRFPGEFGRIGFANHHRGDETRLGVRWWSCCCSCLSALVASDKSRVAAAAKCSGTAKRVAAPGA